ncbi:uncharacterized protein NFIA_085340 [Aspergillus fischeri NRRL 181]|uniref:Uncharacterized protein n=1 Tax=Neosartorya fischeri (strain ATCC 1020 / DSM 3700 / CBS 544.65 / FGSC A1164 / JCM 1740 / NRRL 181 / WB 181) TaxID=331117 RepID=A1DGS4_NEOFI|nr:uncharacterized protein NFIA_085340 [Aspergillus fischeri NRRL 181]EAW18581.1 hypothetical protein NFIA_085340 [Aspergillus fischeri NRRL 181]KAG2007660.1 hypothetical protein GB937_008473 [Aspergillus fischeri]
MSGSRAIKRQELVWLSGTTFGSRFVQRRGTGAEIWDETERDEGGWELNREEGAVKQDTPVWKRPRMKRNGGTRADWTLDATVALGSWCPSADRSTSIECFALLAQPVQPAGATMEE